jgi:hypothetical protein
MKQAKKKHPAPSSSAGRSKTSKTSVGKRIEETDDVLTIRFPIRTRLGWRDKPKRAEQWEDLIGETCVFEFLLHDPIMGIVDDCDEEVADIYDAYDLTRGTSSDNGSMSLNVKAISKIHVLENWYVYDAKRAVATVQEEGLEKLPNEFAAWHARCIVKLSPYVEEWPLAETICMLEDEMGMGIQDGTAYEKEKESTWATAPINEAEATKLAEAAKNIRGLYEKKKIRGDYETMLAESVLRIAELIGVIPTQERGADPTLKGDRDLYDLAIMHNDSLLMSLENDEEA